MVEASAGNSLIREETRKYNKPYERKRIKIISSLIPSTTEHAYALDLGCGLGILAQEITKKGYLYVGCDVSKGRIKLAKSINKFIDFSIADAHHISRVRVAEKWHTLYTKLVRV